MAASLSSGQRQYARIEKQWGHLSEFQKNMLYARTVFMVGRRNRLVTAAIAAALAAVAAFAWGQDWLAAALGFLAGVLFTLIVIWR